MVINVFVEDYIQPDFSIESELIANGFQKIAGIDEAGRGPWAGPVVSASVILPIGLNIEGLNDSKKLTASERERLYSTIMSSAHVGIASTTSTEIDKLNIRIATLQAMRNSLLSLAVGADFALIDGRDVPENLPCPGKAVIKGDSKSISIAAASIIAKVTRDRFMANLALEFPNYGFEKHKGYGTALHSKALEMYGVTIHHRRSYRPIKKLLGQKYT